MEERAMKHLYEKVAYLQGLAEGLEISTESKEGKIIHKIIEVLEDFAVSINDLDEEQKELSDYVENIDEDLQDFEEEMFDENFIEMECPECGELVEIDEKVLYDDELDIVCPNCNEVIISSDEE